VIQVLMIVHALLGVALLGAITHQAFAVARRPAAGKQNVVDRFRGVHAPAFVITVMVIFTLVSLVGGVMYPRYRVDVRTTLEDLQLRAANGLFEVKEHFAAVGLGMLPVYWLSWRAPLAPEWAGARKYLTWTLAFLVWWNFLVGEILNNIKGLFP